MKKLKLDKLKNGDIFDLDNTIYIKYEYNEYFSNNSIIILNTDNFYSYITNIDDIEIKKIFKNIGNIDKNFIKIDNFLINLEFLIFTKANLKDNTLKLIFKNNIKLNLKFENDLLMIIYFSKLNNFIT